MTQSQERAAEIATEWEISDPPAFLQDYDTKPIDRDPEYMDALQVVCAVMAIAVVFGLIWVML
jgi:hypothetical protein